MESTKPVQPKEIFYGEHSPKTYLQNYHNSQIKVIEFDHANSEQAGVIYSMPKDWKNQLDKVLEETEGLVAPEYCMPDLEYHTFREPLTGNLSREISAMLEITPFFSHISKKSGELGKHLIATDIANTDIYTLFEIISNGKYIAENALHKRIPKTASLLGWSEYGYEYGQISNEEYSHHTTNDARHLVTARGLMQEVLRSKVNQITTIWAPKHAERIADYIRRQIVCEHESNTDLNSPVEFKDISPREEKNKMILYGRPPLMRHVREYQPTLSPNAYKIDLLLNERVIDKKLLKTMMVEYLNLPPRSKQEKKYQSRIRNSISKIDKNEDVRQILNTDKIGWRLTRKDYIY